MPNVLNLLPNAVGQPQRQITQAMVSLRQPAPRSFADPLYLTMPLWNPDLNFVINDWPACHGSKLPQQGDEALIVKDDQETFRCIWWGQTLGGTGASFSPDGTAGGDLFGSYPNPTVPTVRGGLVPMTYGQAAGGDLAGSYPDPEVATVLSGKTPVTTTRPTWYGLSYAASWSDYNPTGPWQPGQYCIDQLGFVHLRGLVQKTAAYSAGETLATLPAGYRPADNEMFTCYADDSNMSVFVARVDVYPSGAILAATNATPEYSTPGNMGWLSLSGITFEQGN